jgi:hypothetical protein
MRFILGRRMVIGFVSDHSYACASHARICTHHVCTSIMASSPVTDSRIFSQAAITWRTMFYYFPQTESLLQLHTLYAES